MILKLVQLKPLFDALVALDGTPPHRFSAKVTWNKTKNMRILRERLTKLEEDRNALVTSFLPEGDTAVPKERVPEFLAAFSAMLETDEYIAGLLTIDMEGLNLYDPKDNPSGNVIASTVLEAAIPLVQDVMPA